MVKPISSLKVETGFTRLLSFACVMFISLSGCRQDYSLAPPANSETITVTVKLPKELKTETMWVMYRSPICKSIRRGASGQRMERDGHQSVYKELERQGESDLYQVELPKDGGGACRWHLANVTFGVEYADPTRFGENVTAGGGGGVVVIFDYNDSPRGGADFKVDGDLTIKKDYYPWISESFLGGYKKYISLASEGHIYLKYQALQARRVHFEPVLHSDFAVYSTEPKEKKEGNHTQFTYPDGSVVEERQSQPDFWKLQSLRTGRARECLSVWQYERCPDRRPRLLPEWIPSPEKPGFGQYLIVDEWGNALPIYDYRLVGADGRISRERTTNKGLTQPLPSSVHPLREVVFPVVWK
ncbi:hypothetical protein IFR35_13335 [Pseudomonas fluorescens]|uniref:hypothetical protein n=1 Tax=Pseudomonas fluorescens TaxID=294 RepID=UPI001780858D|nr:hypothetical protein [Pseudomonas fluorescens]MBD8195130.1 hypothetical protein [Pseudomonas fluorescens]MBD8228358.1 hypothetical protein [Pseudomonas fluorescens]MBD8785197.1 hypothetical protein [Pseudomonas fluorescens]MBD8820361.1 hypothetical protein [Pseudomonas fluorescens]